MPLPLAPIATIALRYGVVAIATYAVTRRIERGYFDQRGEDAMTAPWYGSAEWHRPF